MFTQDEIERARYLSRKMFHQDQATALREATEKGFQEGFEKGFQEGLQKGEIGRIHLCQRLLKEPQTEKQGLANLSIGELHAIADDLEERLTKIYRARLRPAEVANEQPK